MNQPETNHPGRFIVSIDGNTISPKEAELLAHPYTAAVILFTRNFTNEANRTSGADKKTIQRLVGSIQAACPRDLPIVMDQEGGIIQRATGPEFPAAPSAKKIGELFMKTQDSLDIEQYVSQLVAPLLECGIINLAPICDLDAGNAVISGLQRAFSSDPHIVAKCVEIFIDANHQHGMSICLKHFPGHGQDNGDSHIIQPTDSRPLKDIMENDLIPFIHNLDKAEAIMPAHIVFSQIDPQNPAGYSPIFIDQILRKKLGYKGIVVSDCLSMAGAGNALSMEDKVTAALKVLDIAIICNQPPEDILKLYQNLEANTGRLPESRRAAFENWTRSGKAQRQRLKDMYIKDNETCLSK